MLLRSSFDASCRLCDGVWWDVRWWWWWWWWWWDVDSMTRFGGVLDILDGMDRVRFRLSDLPLVPPLLDLSRVEWTPTRTERN